MILPLTHDRGTVRRLPLVTFAIMAICLLVHLRVASEQEAAAASAERFETAMTYFAERPYLEVDPRLVPPEITEVLSAYGVDALADGQPSALQQSTLDGYTEDWIASLARQPLWTGGLLPAEIEPFDLVTHVFLHGGWLHLIGNMLFLYFMGPFVEDHYGRWAYAAFYLVGGVAAGLAFALHYPNLFRPLIGASGAVAAVMGAFLVIHGGAKIRFFYWLWIVAGTFTAPAWLMLPIWFAGELVSAFGADAALPGGFGGGVAYWAHVWGFAFGMGVALLLRATGVERRLNPPEMEIGPRAWGAEAAAAGPVGGSWEPVSYRTVEEAVRRGEVGRALAHWREMRDAEPDEPPDARVGVRLAEALAKEGRRVEAGDVLRDTVSGLGSGTPLGVVMKATRLTDDLGERSLHVHCLDLALASPGLPGDLRAELELQRPLR